MREEGDYGFRVCDGKKNGECVEVEEWAKLGVSVLGCGLWRRRVLSGVHLCRLHSYLLHIGAS